MSLFVLGVLMSVWWMLLCWASVSFFNCFEQAGICCFLPAQSNLDVSDKSWLLSFSLLLVLVGSSVHPAIQLRNQNLLSMLNIMLQPRTLLRQSRKEAAPYLNYPVTNLKPSNSSVKSKTLWFYTSRYVLSTVHFFSSLRLLACW